MKSREQYNLIYDNGIDHLTAAKRLAGEKLYGFAVSHIILGIEELIKYQVTQYVSNDDTCFDKEKDLIFKKHETKHLLLKEFIQSTTENFYQDGVELLYKIIVQEELCDELEKTYKNRFRQIGMFLNTAYKELNISQKELDDLIKWLQFANDNKNIGFYVDYRDGRVKSPIDITIEDYTQVEIFGEIIKQYTEVIRSLDITEDEFLEALK